MFTARKYMGAGIVSMRPYGSADPMVDMGDVTGAELAQATEKKTLANLRGGQGDAASTERVTSRDLTLSFADWVSARMAMAFKGTVATEAAGTVTAENVTAKVGSVLRFVHILPSSIVVKDATDATTYTAGTDYKLTHNGIEIPSTGAIATAIAAASPATSVVLHVAYAYSAQKVIEAFVAGDTEWEVHIDGLNDADGIGYTIDLWRWSPKVPDKTALLGTDYQVLAVSGSLLADSAKGSGVSAIMRIKQSV